MDLHPWWQSFTVRGVRPPNREPPLRTTDPIRLCIVGDSTAAQYEKARRPQAGWGQALHAFTAPGVEVVDRARPGASSKSYADNGMLAATARLLGPGDRLLISFGHNDQKLEDPNRGTEPRGSYQRYLMRYVEAARDAGAEPVLVTSVERRRFRDGRAYESLGEYPAAMLALARSEGLPAIDLHAASLARWDELGEEATKDYFLRVEPGHPDHPDGLQDDTHFNAKGAIEVARLVAATAAARDTLGPGVWSGLHREVAEDELVWPDRAPDLT